ncbi:trimethyllysine dioxygenase, mitochondrial [Ctenocephalides felis]|uniref:trimethyllysine dioxygenase, mitochondrial n=1 Tax=Ctenocephalides felis TaxID=7515 RepID=UPI000E6E4074|nr:trimethyllysine dioxygenase, mitochondrial [Ctenocephalides felis]
MNDYSIQIADNFIHLVSNTDEFAAVRIYLRWLRDHCRCDKCYNKETFQRKLTLLELPSELTIEKLRIDNKQLQILWNDKHESDFSILWLLENNYEHCQKKLNYLKKTLWCGDVEINDFAHANRDDLLADDEVAKKIVASLYQYGIALVHQVNPTECDTELVVKRLFPIQRTLFGDMWTFSDEMTHSDTAYTKSALGAHNDNTYFFNAAGLQILHCLEHTGHGGETLLIDGFNIANSMRKENFECFKRLTERVVSSEYIETGYHYTAEGPIIRLKNGSEELEQIRFNIYDRAIVKIPEHDMQNYYGDMKLLSSYITNPKFELWFKLQPGTVLLFDNWRIFHGRAAYTGHRVMSGCYVSRDDWLSKAKTMNII